MSVANRLTTLLRFLAPFLDICTQQKVKVKSLYFTSVARNSHLTNKSEANGMFISPQNIQHTSPISSQTGTRRIVVIFVCKTTLYYKSQQNTA